MGSRRGTVGYPNPERRIRADAIRLALALEGIRSRREGNRVTIGGLRLDDVSSPAENSFVRVAKRLEALGLKWDVVAPREKRPITIEIL